MPKNTKETGKAAASAAGKLLQKPSSPAPVKKVSASDLGQAHIRKKPAK